MQAVSSLLGVNSNAITDTLKLVVIGGTVETARRASMTAWNGFVDSFFLTATFSQEDYPYDWLMHWLSKQPAWGRSREFEITTRSAGRFSLTQSTTGDLEDDEENVEDGQQLVHGRRKRKVAFMPSLNTTHTIYYRGHWLRVTRTQRFGNFGSQCQELKVSVVARNNSVLKKLVLEAKRTYEKDAEHRVHIFIADTYGSWRWNGARQKRPMSSIVLEPGVKDMILNDCKDFLCSEEWYAERGIPFRRGYLLHGVPGSGKTSLIHSLAGELGLDIYVVSLSSKGMSDNTLSSLMGDVPSRCIVLLEDLDAAFTRGVSRDASSTGAPTKDTTTTDSKDTSSDGSTLSLSGLLNSLDGVAAAEGRLLFATTNHIERLDPALSRPGRMDVWVNFANATKWQAKGIFKCFFPYKPSSESTQIETASTPTEQNLPLPRRKSAIPTIPLLSEDELNDLAERFSAAIPEDELSVASLQGYLLKNKTRPRECVNEVQEWIIKERETRAKLKKEKEEVREGGALVDTRLCLPYLHDLQKEEKEAKEKEKAEAKEKEKGKEEKKTEEVSSDKKVESEKDATTTVSTQTTADADKTSDTAAASTTPASESVTTESDSESVSAEDENTKNPTTQSGTSMEKWVSVSPKPTTASS
ncbi:P-loop containing nucleoside triphosphate hydrolase protein [Gautieria morchelliformis]|nr:P-loop containing nucleoside triphosphate hydrolase protein [Gautieria morchelliformis]